MCFASTRPRFHDLQLTQPYSRLAKWHIDHSIINLCFSTYYGWSHLPYFFFKKIELPQHCTTPLDMIAILSPRWSASSMKWVDNIIVLPFLCSCRTSHMCLLADGSIPDVGSSNITICEEKNKSKIVNFFPFEMRNNKKKKNLQITNPTNPLFTDFRHILISIMSRHSQWESRKNNGVSMAWNHFAWPRSFCLWGHMTLMHLNPVKHKLIPIWPCCHR